MTLTWKTHLRLITLALLLLPALAWPWGRYGHEVIGYLAMQDLSAEARAGVAALLGDDDLARIGSWADEVRPERPETGPLHFVNGPVDALMPREENFALAQGNVYSAILGFAPRVVDAELSDSERREALKFLVHFIGDLHQPLHAGFAEDRGGNSIPVLYRGAWLNLHRYWDIEILDTRRERFDASGLAAILHHRFSDAERADWAGEFNVRAWVVEARAYLFNGLYPMPRNDHGAGEEGPTMVLDESYREVWLPVAERQLARAGARLAAGLNALFDSGSSPYAESPVAMPPPAR
ncbi:MAG: hypothetical protein EA418_10695 [Wenzhouxiangellaceae bacterium]|nr:MAG: hypothetical protein EA418_10695 [Wenzhouxiangellaceae bacterium]